MNRRNNVFASLRRLVWPLSLSVSLASWAGCSGQDSHAGHDHSTEAEGVHDDGDDHSTGTDRHDELPTLEHYVYEADPNYAWSVRKTIVGAGYTTYLLQMTSLMWRSAAEVDRTLWQHDLYIIKPDYVAPGPRVLWISSGSNGGTPAADADVDAIALAKMSNSVVVELKQVPNQPLLFSDHDGRPHTEDGIVAFSWQQAMKSGDPTWSARFPMVKSAVRAIDTATEFLYSPQGGSLSIEKFVVMGASLRGWTAWLVAAIDPRVAGVVPFVSDMLNVEKCMRQHIETYGFWSRSLYDYHYNGITTRIGSPELATLLENEDPYHRRERLTMPKYIVNASNDSYSLPDSSQSYLGDLPGETHLRYVPNADRSLRGTDWLDGVAAYLTRLSRRRERPSFTWQFQGDDTIRVETTSPAQKVYLWQASNPVTRDFRSETIGTTWRSSELSALPDQSGVYMGKVSKPAAGFTAFYIELVFPSDLSVPQKYSTQVRVIPDVRPFAGIDPSTAKLEGT